MTIKELEHVLAILQRIKDPDAHVVKAIAYVDKNLKVFAACKGQLKESYDYEGSWL